MAKTKATKVKIKVSGTPAGVQKALHKLSNTEAPAPILREADFRQRNKKHG